jgi:hypothetical protein
MAIEDTTSREDKGCFTAIGKKDGSFAFDFVISGKFE